MKAILVDDEQLALDFLEHQLNKIGGIEIVGKFNNLNFYHDTSLLDVADIIFLDIEMPEMNGLKLAEQFLEKDSSLSIVFVTAYNNYAVEAFALNALDYLLKPVQLDRLQQTLDRVKTSTQTTVKPINIQEHTLRINVCNELTFQTSRDTFEALQWRTTKAQELFLYLLQYSDRSINKSELVDLLWPHFHQDRGYAQLYTAIYHIRKTLRPFRDYIGISSNQDGYRLWTNNISLDITLWETKLKAAEPLSIDTIQDYEAYMQLYTGPYLGSHHYMWAEGERYRLEQLWIKKACQMAAVYEKNDLVDKAVDWYTRICSIRPEDEEANFSLMKAYKKLGLGILVNHQYKQLQRALTDLDMEVSAHIQEWYMGV